MKNLLKLASSITLLAVSQIANATDYYFCDCQTGASNACVAGNNSNSGTLPNNPKQTLGNANSTFNTMSGGDSVKFCRGGSFTSNSKLTWVNNSCSNSNKCNVTSYDLPGQESSGLPKPILTQTVSSDLFSLSDGGNADHEEGYTFSNLDIRCPSCTSGYGFFLYNDVDHVVIDNVSVDGFDVGIHLAKSNPVNPGSDGTLDFITLNNLRVVNNIRQGILGGGNNVSITNSYFENNGAGNVFDHNIYISHGDGISIDKNELYRSSLDPSGNCTGVPLVVHGVVNNLTIENNTIREDIGKANNVCWGIAVDPGYSDRPESFTNVIIRGNKIINVGNLGIGVASCDTCTIENNVILQQQNFGFTAISAPDRSRLSNDQAMSNVTIRNNSIYTSSPGTGISLGTEGNQHVVVSNAIYYTGSSQYTCLNIGLAASAYSAVDNNICYFPNASASSEWEKGSGTSPTPLAAWQGQAGFGLNSKSVNPGYNSPSLPLVDFSPATSSSGAVSSGHSSLSSARDFRGKNRDSQPEAGAFEYGTYNPPAKLTPYIKPKK